MKINEFSYDLKLGELVPGTMPAPTAPAPVTPGATTVGQVQQDPQAQQKMMAQQALDRANKKKEIQDQIKAKQAELQDLQKQLAQIK
jgi:hypothetical protein